MGYQVGRICHQTHEEATNAVMTQVLPTIDKDGVLHHPVFKGKTWVYKEQPVKLTFPQCEYGQYHQAGKEIGIGLSTAAAVLFVVVVAVKAVGMMGNDGTEER
ncbi:hypothetical protein AABM17_2640 [Neisseria musculi]|uniref:Uncharacterized protein n=3 Tax=Neisseria musculi TaxID=1815583 RepID=A0A7H1MAT5_9NEIS|nr:hypothetical protein H7A79_2639 [Neisseria musculi]QNT59005.1 hypothetical protein H7A79_0973 [Neisseria musculi]